MEDKVIRHNFESGPPRSIPAKVDFMSQWFLRIIFNYAKQTKKYKQMPMIIFKFTWPLSSLIATEYFKVEYPSRYLCLFELLAYSRYFSSSSLFQRH